MVNFDLIAIALDENVYFLLIRRQQKCRKCSAAPIPVKGVSEKEKQKVE